MSRTRRRSPPPDASSSVVTAAASHLGHPSGDRTVRPRAGPRGGPRPRQGCRRRHRSRGTSSRASQTMKAMSARRPSACAFAAMPSAACSDRPGREAGEEPLVVEQLTHPAHRVARPDRVARREHRLVVELGHEALVEVAQPVDQLAVARLGRHDLDARHLLAQEPPDTHQRPGGAETGHEVGDRGQVGQDLRARWSRSATRRWPGCRTGRASPSRGGRRRAPWPPAPPRSTRPRPATTRSRRPTSPAAGAARPRCWPASRTPAGSP